MELEGSRRIAVARLLGHSMQPAVPSIRGGSGFFAFQPIHYHFIEAFFIESCISVLLKNCHYGFQTRPLRLEQASALALGGLLSRTLVSGN